MRYNQKFLKVRFDEAESLGRIEAVSKGVFMLSILEGIWLIRKAAIKIASPQKLFLHVGSKHEGLGYF